MSFLCVLWMMSRQWLRPRSRALSRLLRGSEIRALPFWPTVISRQHIRPPRSWSRPAARLAAAITSHSRLVRLTKHAESGRFCPVLAPTVHELADSARFVTFGFYPLSGSSSVFVRSAQHANPSPLRGGQM
jgi:hypothetical protein